MTEPGRNAPCPCGSGLKYKKCCMDRDQQKDTPKSRSAEVLSEIQQLLKGAEFASLDDVNSVISSHMNRRNQAPLEDFSGLSPSQMNRLLNFSFDSPTIATFSEILDVDPEAPVISLFKLLVNAIGDQGLKPTATGNLPRNFCREAALSYWGDEVYKTKTKYGNINMEDDFTDLHVTRLVAELAGLIRKYRGKFILSRDCRRLLSEQGMAGIYPRLFRAYVKEFNWGYRDRYPEFEFFQQSFLFTLYLLAKKGEDWKFHTFYEDCFLRAFPDLLNEVSSGSYFSQEEIIRSCYTLRTMENFVGFFGLGSVEKTTEERYVYNFRVRQLPLLKSVVTFRV
ncbi:YecA family protein [Trichloromonas sp.]|uniref:YecA family protein n=1 Tax=Trichloromonas sp. TaxID=3069249 RepID=UPI003D815217